MELEPIKLYNQNITEKILIEAMHACYNNICFSTFPYIEGKILLSKECIEKNHSGNCIAMSTFIQMYLKNNYNINGNIIIASVPDSWREKGQSDICHCAFLIPKSKHTFYIIDCAFQFKGPLFVDTKDPTIKTTIRFDIHKNVVQEVNYSIDETVVSCNYGNLKWNYYINEIKNPDETIGKEYHKIKKDPFLVQTQIKNNKIIKTQHIKKELDTITFVNGNKSDSYFINNIPKEKQKILKQLHKYLRNTI